MADDDPIPTAAPPRAAIPDIPAEEASAFASLELQGEANGLGSDDAAGKFAAGRLDMVLDVPVRLSVELGRTDIAIRDVVTLGRGSMVELDRAPGAPLDVRINGVLIGRGEVVLVNEERLGLRFLEVVSQAERMKRLG